MDNIFSIDACLGPMCYNDGDEDNRYKASLDSCIYAIKVYSEQVTLTTCCQTTFGCYYQYFCC